MVDCRRIIFSSPQFQAKVESLSNKIAQKHSFRSTINNFHFTHSFFFNKHHVLINISLLQKLQSNHSTCIHNHIVVDLCTECGKELHEGHTRQCTAFLVASGYVQIDLNNLHQSSWKWLYLSFQGTLLLHVEIKLCLVVYCKAWYELKFIGGKESVVQRSSRADRDIVSIFF